jgi:hypothetical protein
LINITFKMLLFFQKKSPFLIRPFIVPRNFSPIFSSIRFCSGYGKDGVVSDDKGVGKLEPGDSLPMKKTTNDRLFQNPLMKQTQIRPHSYTIQKQQKNVSLQTREMKFETQVEVDTFIQNSLPSCSIRNITDLFRISGKVTKRNRKFSFLKKHLPAIH